VSGLNLELDDRDGVSGGEVGVSLGIAGKPRAGQEDQAEGVFVEVSGKGDWDEPSYWGKAWQKLKETFRR
jgi:hypothetical protein